MTKPIILFFVGILFAVHATAGRLKGVVPFAAIDDAETALDVFRQVGVGGLNQAAGISTNLSKQVDYTAIATKAGALYEIQKKSKLFLDELKESIKNKNKCAGFVEKSLHLLEKTALQDVTSCVNEKAKISIDYIFTHRVDAIDFILIEVFEAQSQIIACGKDDDACLSGVIDVINGNTDQAPHQISALVEEVAQAVASQLLDIEACKDQGISKIELGGNLLIKSFLNC